MSTQSNTPSEEQLKAQCYQWFYNSFPALRGLLFHIPNGGNRSMREGAKFKAIGVVPGIPDLQLCVPSNPTGCTLMHGLFIEMKADGGKLSELQVKAHKRLKSAGYEVITVNNFSDFEQKLRIWIAYSPINPLL